MPRVTAPTPFTGRRAGVTFVDGQADTDDPAALAYFARQGYSIADSDPGSDGDQSDGSDADSDPGSDGDQSDGPTPPAGNASHKAWAAHAVALGLDEATAGAMSRDELRAAYGEAGD